MAFKDFSKFSTRNQSSIISQLYSLIKYYGDFFCPRERVYLKELSKTEKNIYWLEGKDKKLVAAALLEPDHSFKLGGIDLLPLGYTVSKAPGYMSRIFDHIFSDYEEHSIIFFCRRSLANSMEVTNYGLTHLTLSQLNDLAPELAQSKTNYFNVKNDILIKGLERKQDEIYLKLSQSHKQALADKYPKLIDYLNS
jgi:hypothetical protein